MTPTKISTKTDADDALAVLHLVTPQSRLKPLCGETSPDASIGACFEHLDGGQWLRQITTIDGKPGKPCPVCIAKYPFLSEPIANNHHCASPHVLIFTVTLGVFLAPFLVWLLFKL